MSLMDHTMVNLQHYGRRLQTSPAVVAPGITRTSDHVLVSGEYVRTGDGQQKMERDTWRRKGASVPVVERHYRYVEVDGLLLPALVEQTVRHGGTLRQDTLRRQYDASGRVIAESHVADQKIVRQRQYHTIDGRSLVHEDVYGLDGGQTRRSFAQDDRGWRMLKTEFSATGESTAGRERALGLPVLEGRQFGIVWLEPMVLPAALLDVSTAPVS